MNAKELEGTLEFLRGAERLKSVTRSAYTSEGQQESVAEHTWRLCLMSVVFADSFPGVDFARLVKICVIHDLGEAIGGDIPALGAFVLPGNNYHVYDYALFWGAVRRDAERRLAAWQQ